MKQYWNIGVSSIKFEQIDTNGNGKAPLCHSSCCGETNTISTATATATSIGGDGDGDGDVS